MEPDPQSHTSASPAIEMREVEFGSLQGDEGRRGPPVTWGICPGDLWIVVGSAGSGKTDLLATVAGLIQPRAGEHLFFGQISSQLSMDELGLERLRVGIVFGSGGRLFEDMTVAENVALPLCYHRDRAIEEAPGLAAALIESTGLGESAHVRTSRLGRAMKHRVALARALALKPEVLLLDDPLVGVEPRQTRWWIDFIASLIRQPANRGAERMAIVVATTDFRPWVEIGHSFALLTREQWRIIGDRTALMAEASTWSQDGIEAAGPPD
jgi:ABC-type transporter Mla maintaining outer membrane lipid asymmetry ATPase subunit MlaF